MKTKLLHIFMVDFFKGWGVRRHSHDFYQIWHVVTGKAIYLLDDQEIEISAGDLIFLHPGVVHELPVMQEGLLRYVDIKFQISDAQLRAECAKLPTVMRLNSKSLNSDILKCRDNYYENDSYSFDIANLLFEQVLLEILKMQQTPKKYPLWLPTKKSESFTGIAADVSNYIDTHYAEEFTLSQLADHFGYNKTYLCKLFKDATGMTIVNYLNYVRVARAYDLICYTSDTMSKICLMVGFSSIHYFTRIFKKICGMPPGEIRELHKDSIRRDIRLHGNFNYRYYVEL